MLIRYQKAEPSVQSLPVLQLHLPRLQGSHMHLAKQDHEADSHVQERCACSAFRFDFRSALLKTST